jgi:hypothetical protein
MKNLLTLLIAICLIGCTVDQATAEQVLADEGFHDVQVTGWAPFSCSDDDTFKSHFCASRTVVNPDGTTSERHVSGTICCGYFKDCTVRH